MGINFRNARRIITDTKEKITNKAISDSNVKLIPAGTTLLSFKLSIGKTAIAGKDLYTNEAIAGIIPNNKEELLDRYLFYFFSAKIIDLENVGYKAFGKSLNSTYLNKEVKIPIPPLELQQQIISECEEIDEDYTTAQKSIADAKKRINEIVDNVQSIAVMKLEKIASYITEKIPYKNINPANYISTDNLLQNCEGVKLYDGIPKIKKVVCYKKDDVLVSNIRPYLKKVWLADSDGGCSPDVLVFRVLDINLIKPKYLFTLICQDKFFNFMMAGSNGVKMPRGDTSQISNYSIPIPSVEEQNQIISQIEKLQSKINESKKIISTSADRKKQVLEKYLC